MLNLVFFPFIIALLITILLIPPLMKAASRAGLLDIPNPRKVHRSAIPRVGGIALGTAAILSILFWLPIDREIAALLIGFGILLVFGAWDDKANIDYRIKLTSQFVAALVVVWYGHIYIHRIPFFEGIEIPFWLSSPFTIFFIVGITNAINLADGLDGLSGGKTLLIFVCMAILAYHDFDPQLILLNVIFVGAILGFLRFNTYPAQVFMGDAGSQTLGFSSAVLALILTQHPDAAFSPALPMLLFAVPICDTTSVIVQRIANGRSPFSPDKNHLHHKLLAYGFSQFGAITIIYVVQTILVTIAYFARYERDELIVGIFVAFAASVSVLLMLGKKPHASMQSTPHTQQSNRRIWYSTIGAYSSYVLLPTLLIAGIIAVPGVPEDLSVAAGLVLLVLLLCSVSRFKLSGLVFRLSAYLACVFSIHLLNRYSGGNGYIEPLFSIGFALLAITTTIGIRFSSRHAFLVTPLDILVIFLCLVVPTISIAIGRELPIAIFSVRLVVLMYACEFVFASKQARIWEAVLGPLGMVAVSLSDFFA